jgi:hypothetical protein
VDLNGDRQREHALVSRDLLSLWSRRTGALLHLFDRPTGDEMVGNELAASSIFGLGFDEEQIPEVKRSALTWSGFRSGRQRLKDFDGLWREVPWHRSWLRYLIDWNEMRPKPKRIRQVTVDRRNLWSLENGSREEAGFHWPPPVRQRAMVERLTVDGELTVDVAEMSRMREAPARLRETTDGFEITLSRRPIELIKRVAQSGRAIRVDYRLVNRSAHRRTCELQIHSEWVPSYLAILLFGRRSLEITGDGARNAMTGAGVLWEMDVGDAQRAVTESLLGVVDTRLIGLALEPGESRDLRTTLRVERGKDFGALDEVAATSPLLDRGH